MRFIRALTATALVAVAGAGCADLEVTNFNAPDRSRAISSPGDVEALISGSFQTWWGATHYSYPSSALSTAADAHSSSWGNWGMRDFGWEPRKEFDNSPSYSYRWVAQTPWGDYYTAIAAVNDGLKAIADGVEIGEGGADTQRAIFMARLVQGLSLGYLALLFDQAWIVDETTDLATLDADAFQPYTEVWAAAKAKLQQAIDIATANDFTIPSAWVGFGGDWDSEYAAQFVRGYRARFESQVARTTAERDAAPWSQILSDAQAGIPEGADYAGYDDGGASWAWSRSKLHACCIAGWARIDYRTIGPADASGAYQAWLAESNPDFRTPFNIVTTDSRITGQVDTDGDGETYDEDGSLILYLGNSPFPASRGTYHYSNYMSDMWTHIVDNSYIGYHPDLTHMEMEFLMAEAYLRGQGGGAAAAMEIVNKYRANGGLPAFTDPAGVAPGGAQCVPKTASGACGTLLDAFKYEKRIELFHFGLGTEYFDDRGWGDLVQDTPLQLPVPGQELELLLQEIYTFGGPGDAGAAPNIVGDISPEALKLKRAAIERFQAAKERAQVGIVH